MLLGHKLLTVISDMHFLYDQAENPNKWNSFRMNDIDTASLQCESSHVFSDILAVWISCHIANTRKAFLQCEPTGAVSVQNL